MSHGNIVVLKFGSSVLRSETDLPRAVHEIYRHWRSGNHVVAVASALGNTTNRLLRLANDVSHEPAHPAVAALVSSGETTSSALLTLALDRAGIPAKLLDPAQAGLRTVGNESDSEPVSLDVARLRKELEQSVVVLPGFAGRNDQGDTTLLGRGGSDLSAIFVAQQLGAHCILLKDVDGLYTSDPANSERALLRFRGAKYETALHVGGSLVQSKAVQYAAKHCVRFEISAISAGTGTEIGADADIVENPKSQPRRLRVALLGCGTVGGGVYERLAALPEFFEVVGVAVRNISRERVPCVPKHLLSNKPNQLINAEYDVLVELIGGTNHASALIEHALHLGRHVVTANKALIARAGEHLRALAEANDVTIRAGAAVGGALPALELIDQARSNGPISGLGGVLNGTTNFIIDQLAHGEELEHAIEAAQRAGYAEADPTLDLNGTDSAQKLIMLARAAFGISLPFEKIARQGVEHLDASALMESGRRGSTIRLVATCRWNGAGLHASVAPVEVPISSPFGQLRGAQNGLLVETNNGWGRVVRGIGAGRWPTTEAVMADLLALHCELAAHSTEEQLEEFVA